MSDFFTRANPTNAGRVPSIQNNAEPPEPPEPPEPMTEQLAEQYIRQLFGSLCLDDIYQYLESHKGKHIGLEVVKQGSGDDKNPMRCEICKGKLWAFVDKGPIWKNMPFCKACPYDFAVMGQPRNQTVLLKKLDEMAKKVWDMRWNILYEYYQHELVLEYFSEEISKDRFEQRMNPYHPVYYKFFRDFKNYEDRVKKQPDNTPDPFQTWSFHTKIGILLFSAYDRNGNRFTFI